MTNTLTTHICDQLLIYSITPNVKRHRNPEERYFCGNPYILLKTWRKGSLFGWQPLTIELSLTDDDDYDKTWGYQCTSEAEFNELTTILLNWIINTNFRRVKEKKLYYDFESILPLPEKLRRVY